MTALSSSTEESPRILFVIKRMTTGGAERHLAQLLPALKDRGLDVELFVLERGGPLELVLTAAGVSIAGPVRCVPSVLHVLVAGFYLLRRVLTRRPDILHFFLPEPYLVGASVAVLAGQRHCIMSRRSLTHYHRKHPWLARLEKLFHHRMMALLGNSRAVADELVTENGDSRKVGRFFDDLLNEKYQAETRLKNITVAFALLAIIISVLGILGMAIFSIDRRTKEIGIRRVAGAKSSEILILLNKEFIIWVFVAFIIASPVAWYTMNKWLQNFVYKTEFSWWIFLLSGIIAFGIALITVNWQSWRAATRNPVEALRYE